jgi:hypothetical protein
MAAYSEVELILFIVQKAPVLAGSYPIHGAFALADAE